METSPPRNDALGFSTPRSDSQAFENGVQVQRISGIEKTTQRGLDDGAVAGAFLERKVSNLEGGIDVERDGEPRMTLRLVDK